MSKAYSFWNELGGQVSNGNHAFLQVEELARHIDLAQTPEQLHQLAWALAVQGEVVLWMHTLNRALFVLNRELLAVFIELQFTGPMQVMSQGYAVAPHVATMYLLFLTRLGYKSEAKRPHVMDILNSGSLCLAGRAELLPQASTQCHLPPQ